MNNIYGLFARHKYFRLQIQCDLSARIRSSSRESRKSDEVKHVRVRNSCVAVHTSRRVRNSHGFHRLRVRNRFVAMTKTAQVHDNTNNYCRTKNDGSNNFVRDF